MPPTPSVLPSELEARKNEAEVAKAEAEAEKARAEAVKAAAEAERDAAAARRAQLTALLPNLSEVEKSALEEEKGPALRSTLLTFGAIRLAAQRVASELLPANATAASWRVLVTSDPDLAGGDAVFQDVRTSLAEVKASAESILVATGPMKEPDGKAMVADVVAALASAIPHVLSLFSARRSVRAAAFEVDDLAAVAEVARALTGRGIVLHHADFRLLGQSAVYDTAAQVANLQSKLAGRKIELEDAESKLDAELKHRQKDEGDIEKEVAAPSPPPDARQRLTDVRKKIEELRPKIANAMTRIGLVDSSIASIDAYLAALRAAPQDGGRSPLATAALHEALHDGNQKFTHVLLVKGGGGQAEQVVENRPLWLKDRFSTVVDVTITYLLIVAETSELLASGATTGTATAHGTIGGQPQVSPPL